MMETNSITSINIEDFKDSDFGDPISLLEALAKKRNQSSRILLDPQSKESEYFTVSQIARIFNVEEADFLKAIETGDVVADRVVPLFTKDTVEQFLNTRDKDSSTLYESFMQEISHMRVNYSYKPVLIMALLNGASSNGEMSHLMATIAWYGSASAKRRFISSRSAADSFEVKCVTFIFSSFPNNLETATIWRSPSSSAEKVSSL